MSMMRVKLSFSRAKILYVQNQHRRVGASYPATVAAGMPKAPGAIILQLSVSCAGALCHCVFQELEIRKETARIRRSIFVCIKGNASTELGGFSRFHGSRQGRTE
jgi:hypothetical protein